MPELPEVETTKRGIERHVTDAHILGVIAHSPKLRWPIPQNLNELLVGERIQSVSRRAKYLLLHLPKGCLIIHLGMSGSLRIAPANSAAKAHDRFEMILSSGILRLRDPRKFGAVLWTEEPVEEHRLIAPLGPEPFAAECNADYLFERSRGRSCSIKTFIMNAHIIVGVGNIYAAESLFAAGIHPQRAAGRISKKRYADLVEHIQRILKKAIAQGGTSLRDFVNEEGKPGYFSQELKVYGRAGEACTNCQSTLLNLTIGQRSSVYCAKCQR